MSADNYFITDQNSVCFLTFTVTDWIDVFSRKEYKFEIVDSLNYCIKHKGLTVFAWCLMSNHIHLVCRAEEGFRISKNPVRAFIVAESHEYLFSPASDYAGEKGLVNVQTEI